MSNHAHSEGANPSGGGKNYLLIGKLVKPYGLKGEMKAELYADSLGDLNAFTAFFIAEKKTPGGFREMPVNGIKIIGKSVIVKVDGLDDISLAESYRNTGIYVLEEELPRPKTGTYYIKDLMDCRVTYNNALFGRVVNVLEIASHSMLVVRMENGKDLVVPFDGDYIETVQVGDKTVTAKNLDRLL